MRIALIGLPGCGKSTIGQKLAKNTEAAFFDSDSAIEKQINVSIQQYFSDQGEAAFRLLESETVEKLVNYPSPWVLSTGGGVILNENNRKLLRMHSHVVYIDACLDKILENLSNSGNTRPLMNGVDIETKLKSLYQERDALYRATAHSIISQDFATADEWVKFIEKELKLF